MGLLLLFFLHFFSYNEFSPDLPSPLFPPSSHISPPLSSLISFFLFLFSILHLLLFPCYSPCSSFFPFPSSSYQVTSRLFLLYFYSSLCSSPLTKQCTMFFSVMQCFSFLICSRCSLIIYNYLVNLAFTLFSPHDFFFIIFCCLISVLLAFSIIFLFILYNIFFSYLLLFSILISFY